MRVPQAISKIIDRIDVITSKFDDTHLMARNIRWRVACFCLKAIRCFLFDGRHLLTGVDNMLCGVFVQ